jgi:hypothetical protein
LGDLSEARDAYWFIKRLARQAMSQLGGERAYRVSQETAASRRITGAFSGSLVDPQSAVRDLAVLLERHDLADREE